MAKRSLQASLTGIQQAKRAFARKGWTQENLAGEVNLKTRQPIWRFFTGRPVDRYIFLEVCSVLDLNWREIAIDPPAEFSDPGAIVEAQILDIDVLVQQVRSQRQDKIQDQCGTLQLLDTNRLVGVDDIYIDVNILEEITSDRWLDADMDSLSAKEFDGFGLGEVSQKQIAGVRAVETYSKLRVLGKPGSGKTTFLQHLALQCDRGEFAANRVPIFITLRDFADESQAGFSLLNYIQAEFLTSEISTPSILETLLCQGRVLLLLDGLDEVLDRDRNAVLKEIRRFSEKYQKNLLVAASRTAAKMFKLKGFRDVEIAPFTQAQITAFALKWFAAFTQENSQDEPESSVQFIQKLSLPENWQFRQLAVTPLFLHLACWVFHRQEKFPSKRAEFYKQCLDLLLVKWDEARGVQRDEVYREFLLPQKLRLLSQIAAMTFEQGHYFFKQRVIERHISNYIRDLPNASTQLEELQLDSEVVLKAIELQHGLLTERARGIFSFSYLAFQEYFTARKIVASHNLQALEQALERLVSHITEPRWREIFLLTAGMLRSADTLVQLMKQQIDALVAQDPYLQEFLTWASQKSLALPPPSLAATRAFYLALTQTPHLASHFALACTLDQSLFLDVALDDLVLECAVDEVKLRSEGNLQENVNFSSDLDRAHALSNTLSNTLAIVLDVGLHHSLQQLKDQLPDPEQDRERFQAWWPTQHLAWTERLKAAIALHRNVQHHWDFSLQQQQTLQRYYDANQLLIDCLNSNCEVTVAVRQEIEASLLLPQKELEHREWQN